jgi:hypothetical protein
MDVDRDVINNLGFNGDNIPDILMEKIASYVGNYFDDLFSDALYEACEHFKVTRKED